MNLLLALFSLFIGTLGKYLISKFIFLNVLLINSLPADGNEMVKTGIFSYEDHDWFLQSPICTEGIRQSPINIISRDTKFELSKKKTFQITGFNTIPESIEIVNKFHSILVNPEFGSLNHPIITGGPLNTNIYKFAQFHIHFGCNSTSGAEHRIDGIGGPMEIHLVFYNEKYGSFRNAADKSDGLCAVGFLYKV